MQCLLESLLFISTEASLKEQKQQFFFQLFLSASDKISLSVKGKVSLLLSWVKIKTVPYLSQQLF